MRTTFRALLGFVVLLLMTVGFGFGGFQMVKARMDNNASSGGRGGGFGRGGGRGSGGFAGLAGLGALLDFATLGGRGHARCGCGCWRVGHGSGGAIGEHGG